MTRDMTSARDAILTRYAMVLQSMNKRSSKEIISPQWMGDVQLWATQLNWIVNRLLGFLSPRAKSLFSGHGRRERLAWRQIRTELPWTTWLSWCSPVQLTMLMSWLPGVTVATPRLIAVKWAPYITIKVLHYICPAIDYNNLVGEGK